MMIPQKEGWEIYEFFLILEKYSIFLRGFHRKNRKDCILLIATMISNDYKTLTVFLKENPS